MSHLRTWVAAAVEGRLFSSAPIELCALPALFYFASFVVLTWPMVSLFSSHFFAGPNDGMQNVWNLWWVNQAVTELGQSPWHTDYLHRPWGISLLPHTLNAFNGFLGIVLQAFLTLKQTHNAIVVFSFVMGGVTAFWLAWHLVGRWWPSLLAGFIFTFSNYHFAHAEGHLQLVSLEWIPLFLLSWHIVVTRPSWLAGLGAGAALFLVILCDYYYFFYCVLSGALILLWYAWKSRTWRFLVERQRLIAFGVFMATVVVTVAPLALSLLALHLGDPLRGVHQPRHWSADLLASLVPGGHWRFAGWTRGYWERLPGNIHEKSVHLGLSVVALLVWVGVARRRVRAELGVWVVILAFFWLAALGPVLQIAGRPIEWLKMPYALLEHAFPPIEMSGCPVRMTVMVTLAAGLISAAGLALLLDGGRLHRALAALFVVVLVFEYWPRPMPVNEMRLPPHVRFLADQPKDRVLIDRAAPGGRALYYQTVHQIPMALGYTSRVPESLAQKERPLRAAAKREDFAALHEEFGIRYFLKSDGPRTLVFDTATREMLFPTLAPAMRVQPQIRVGLRLVEKERLEDRWRLVVELRFTNTGGGVFDLDKVTACQAGLIGGRVFEVRQGDDEIDYQGMVPTYAGPDRFFHLRAGESVEALVDIGKRYRLPDSGQLSVRFNHLNRLSEQRVQLTSNEVFVSLP